MTRRARRPIVAAIAAGAAALAAAAPASAGLLAADATNCPDVSTARVFSPWADYANYFLAPGGSFEAGGEGWDLGGASVVADNESFEVSGPGSKALAIPSGATVTTDTVCVGIDRPSSP